MPPNTRSRTRAIQLINAYVNTQHPVSSFTHPYSVFWSSLKLDITLHYITHIYIHYDTCLELVRITYFLIPRNSELGLCAFCLISLTLSCSR